MEQPDPVAFDVDAALVRLGGDSALLAELVEAFLQHAPAVLNQIHDAAAGEEAKALEVAAHSLKGMAANLDAEAVTGLAARLEIAGRNGDLSEVCQGVSDLDSGMEELRLTLTDYLSVQCEGKLH